MSLERITLSRREREITELAANGMAAREISLRLGISNRTVQHTIERARFKSGGLNVAHHVAISLSRGWIQPLVVTVMIASTALHQGAEMRGRSSPTPSQAMTFSKRRGGPRIYPSASSGISVEVMA
ncbi:helix-turn-helix domain-containing protein [Carnimonas bestiolae]